jgi:hypothetical protein
MARRIRRNLGRACRVKIRMKLLFEILVSLILHPIAFVLALINIAGRNDLNDAQKIIWAVLTFVWGIGPILYVLVGGGSLW